MKKIWTVCVVALFATTAAYGGAITTVGDNAGVQLDIIGVTGFTTLGSDMAGIEVTVSFGQSGVHSCTWVALTATSGGCTVAGLFDIVQDGDTFTNPWTLTNLTTFDIIRFMEVDGVPSRSSSEGIVFDRTFGGVEGTLGSALGADATGATSDASNGFAQYNNLVALQGDPPVGDIFNSYMIAFDGPLGAGATATYVADSDTIGIFVTPEPGTLSLLTVGLAALLIRRRSLQR